MGYVPIPPPNADEETWDKYTRMMRVQWIVQGVSIGFAVVGLAVVAWLWMVTP